MSFSQFLYCALLLCSSSVFSQIDHSFKVMWWNIGHHHKQVNNNLNLNLEDLTNKGIDLIGLGETILENFPENFIEKIKIQYPYRAYKKYGILKKNGIWILSKYPFRLKTRMIPWIPVDSSELEREIYIKNSKKKYSRVQSFYRSQSYIEMTKENKEYHVIFYHLSNPWVALVKNTSKYKAAWEILVGRDNPVTNQISHLRENLKNELGDDYYQKRVIMMGDSNCPRKIKGISTACYRNLIRTLPAVLDKKVLHTYPADKSTDYKVRIDHAQASDAFKDKSLKILETQGSDHFPLILSIKN